MWIMRPLLRALLLAAAASTIQCLTLTSTLSPECPKICGGVDIPYPFGVGANCSRKGFEISCDRSNDGAGTPVLAGTSLRVMHLSVDPAESKVMLPIGWQCYNASDPTDTYSNWSYSETKMNGDGVYRISSTHNMLVVIGCNTVGFTASERTEGGAGSNSGGYYRMDYAYYTGCMAYCNNSASAQDGLCAGVGCCHVEIPAGLTDNYFNFRENDHTGMMDYSPCDYAFLVDRTNYTFARSDLKMDTNRTMPVWLNWAIRDHTSCADAARTTAEYACKSDHSSCADSVDGPGYTCKCSEGYQGNAYVRNGCSNINECERPDQYPCKGVCKDTQGSYQCSCRSGYQSDDPKTQRCTPKFPFVAQLTTGIILGVSVLSVGALSAKLLIQKKIMEELFKKNGGLILETVESLKIFDKEEISKITNNHSDLLGKGSFGKVYKGTLPDNTIVAVKDSIEVKGDTLEEFTKEVQIQSKMTHENILKLFGCCLQEDVPKLVYEFASRGSLRDILHDGKHEKLPPCKLLDIAIGSAEGLRYMHSNATEAIRHGDVNPDNILLDDKLVPKIFSDFGLSRVPNVGKDSRKIAVGSIGYMDPVLVKTGLLTQKSDVYSFGVVLLELITGKKIVYDDNRSLVMEFRKVYEKENSGRAMFDTGIEIEEDILMLEEIGKLAIECLNEDIEDRPDMGEVAERLAILRRNRKQVMGEDESPELLEEIGMRNNDINETINATLSMLSIPTKKDIYAYARKLVSYIISKFSNACMV